MLLNFSKRENLPRKKNKPKIRHLVLYHGTIQHPHVFASSVLEILLGMAWEWMLWYYQEKWDYTGGLEASGDQIQIHFKECGPKQYDVKTD